jgi:hypothetical protein
MEIKQIILPELNNYYYVSDTGLIFTKSSGKLVPMNTKHRKYEEITLSLAGGGRGNQQSFLLHRLIMITFKPIEGKVHYTDYSDMEVNHIDLNKLNNSLENLEWTTRAFNMEHAYQTGQIRKGSDVNFAVLDEQKVREIKQLLAEGKMTQKEIGEKYGVSRVCISNIKTGKNWKHVEI